jgi:cell division protein FtsX
MASCSDDGGSASSEATSFESALRNVIAACEAGRVKEVEIFLRPESSAAEQAAFVDSIVADPAVWRSSFLDEREAYHDFLETFSGEPDVQEALVEGEVPPSLRLELTSTDDARALLARIRDDPIVLTVNDGGGMCDEVLDR